MATNFLLSGALELPPDAGQPVAQVPFSGAGSFQSKAEVELNILGAGSTLVPFGTIGAPGAKAVLVEVDSNSSGDPVNLRFNGAGVAGQLELAPGGILAFFNPTPVTGLTAMEIVSTTANRVRVRVLG